MKRQPAKPIASRPMPSSHPNRRVFVVDDHPLMRRSLVDAIEREPDLTVCGQAADAPAAWQFMASLHPDIILTDLDLKTSSGLDLLPAPGQPGPAIPVVVTTMFEQPQTARIVLAAGAAGYISKQAGPEPLIALLRQVLSRATGS